MAGSRGSAWPAQAGRPRGTATCLRRGPPAPRRRPRSSNAPGAIATPLLHPGRRPGPHPSTGDNGPARTPDPTAGGTDGLPENVVAHDPHRVHSTTESNGTVERMQETWRGEFYEAYDLPTTVTELRPLVQRFQNLYNTYRPHQSLQRQTPARYLQSLLPGVRLPPLVSHVLS